MNSASSTTHAAPTPDADGSEAILVPDLAPGLLRMPDGLGEHPNGAPLPVVEIMSPLAARLNEAAIPWVVLRNADGLPRFTRYDVDILVAPRCIRDVRRGIEACARTAGWRLVGHIRKRAYECFMLLKWLPGGDPFFLPLDVFTGLEFRGARFLRVEEVIEARVNIGNNIWGLPPGLEAAITLLKEVLPHGRLKENSRASVQRQAGEDPFRFRATLEQVVGPELAALLLRAVEDGNWTLPADTARALHARVSAMTPWRHLRRLHAAACAVRHVLRRQLSFTVYLAGPDGSGKSTLAARLAARTFKRPFKACRYVHGNVGVLPRFRDMRARFPGARRHDHTSSLPDDTPLRGMLPPLPAWKSMLLASYYALDLLLAHPMLRFWRGQWSLILMDRSFYDYTYQLGHSRIPRRYLAFLTALTPNPDLLICIEREPERIHAQKPELTVSEIRREQDVLRLLAARTPFAVTANADDGIEALTARCTNLIWKRLLGAPGDL